ncbi:MAG: 50S ribosomal protein L9 [Prevotellaceae bacterium]|jgi:large subunit ribosomal protein L9|nr:50S ribosomal protein L9 [Prevotellaceae bacterium]
MEIILKQDVAHVGQANDIVTVRNGYASNYLIPQGYAIMATSSAKKIHAENLKQRAHKESKIREQALAAAGQIDGLTVNVVAKVSSSGKIFGSVNNIQIAEALVAKGYDIDRRNITILGGDDHVKEVGIYQAEVKLHRDVKVRIQFEVVGE